MKRMLAVTIVMLLIGLPTITINVTATRKTIHVDDDSPCPGDGSEIWPYCKIQYAIDNASANDIIEVAPGKYEEYLTIWPDLTKLKIKLWEEKNDPRYKNPWLFGNGTGTGITIQASLVEITKLNITHYGQNDLDAGIYIHSGTFEVKILENNISSVHTGIWIKRDNPDIKRHKIQKNHIYNITSRGISIIMADENIIDNNIIEKCRWGFYIVDANANQIYQNTISYCFEGGVIDVGMSNQVVKNTFRKNNWGFVIVNTKGTIVQENNFLEPFNNGFPGTDPEVGPVWFRTFFINTLSDKWSGNYWGRIVFWPLKPILGDFVMPGYIPIYWLKFEKFPSLSEN